MAKENPTTQASHLEPLSIVWRVFAAPQTLMVLLAGVALSLALACLIPQIPPQDLADPQAWLAVQTGPLATASSPLRALGLYDVYHSFWFRLLLVLTGLTLFVWMVDAADLAWRATSRRPWPSTAFVHWGSHPAQARVPSFLSPEQALAQLHAFLGEQGYHWAGVPDLPAPNLVAARRGAALWSRPVALGALLLALIGLAILGSWGWQEADWHPAPGDTLHVGHDTPYGVRLDSFMPGSDPGGGLCTYQSQITWLENDEPLGQGLAANGQPVTFRGLALRQMGYVPALQLRAWDENGQPLTLQLAGSERIAAGRIDVAFASTQSQPLVLILDGDLLLSFRFEPVGANGQPLLQLFLISNGGANPELVGTLSESGSLSAHNLQIDVDLAYRPILQVSHSPAASLILGGLLLGLVALAVAWLVPARLVWLSVAPGEEEEALVRLLAPAGGDPGRWLPRLAARLGEVLADDA
jgi:hypothetical protein